MPRLPVVFFQDEDGSIPLLMWLENEVARRDNRIAAKCFKFIEILSEMGTKLPAYYAKLLRDGIWELRVDYGSVNYRILYFFSKTGIVVLSHGLTKEDIVPPKEVDLAIKRKITFERNPDRHSYVKKTEAENI